MNKVLQRIQNIKIFKTLRFRLASTFLLMLIFVTIAVGLAGIQLLRSILETRSEQALQEELAAIRGYVYFDDNGVLWWKRDASDPEEVADLERLRSLAIIESSDGTIFSRGTYDHAFDEMMSRSAVMQDLHRLQANKTPLFKTIRGDEDGPYLVLGGLLTDTVQHKDWYVAIARPVAENHQLIRKFQRNYFLLFVPATIFLCVFISWFSAGKAITALQAVEFAARDITGSNLGLQIPLRGANDELDRLIGSFNEMSRRLKGSFEQIRQFSTDVSHELRTPLTAIQGQLEVALFTAKGPEQLREAIENALQDVERLSNLVRALLLLSHAETGQLPMNRTVVNLSEMVSELVEQYQIPAEACEVHLQYLGGPPVFCEVDRIQMERVITNLLSNAIKYTSSGGWVKARTEASADSVCILIEDSGIGIPHDHLPHIFDRFYRVPDPNPEKGLGLGLSFVASIVKAHGGTIQVESEVGRGSCFTVLLPQPVPKPVVLKPGPAVHAQI